MSNPIPPEIHGQKYICLTTFRKSGHGVSTPVWFGEDNGKLYIMTRSDSGKYKRIRNNPRVQIAPCTMRGKIKGPQFPATPRILPPEEWAHAKQTIHRKVIDDILEHDGKIDAVIFTGDAVMTNFFLWKKAYWKCFLSQSDRFRAAGIPFFPSLGNHDGNESEKHGDLEAMLDNFPYPQGKPGRYYDFTYGDFARFFALDSTRNVQSGPAQSTNTSAGNVAGQT